MLQMKILAINILVFVPVNLDQIARETSVLKVKALILDQYRIGAKFIYEIKKGII